MWFNLILIVFLICAAGYSFKFYRKSQKAKWDDHIKQYEKDNYERKVRFLININHELRTPLSLISLPVERLRRNDNWDRSEVERVLSVVERQAGRMKNVIDMVLDIRKVEHQNSHARVAASDFNEWLESIVSEFESEFKVKGLNLTFVPEPLVESVLIDADKLRLVMNNLLSNAYKFSVQSGTVTVIVEKIENKVRVSVQDQGIGIADLNLNKLFSHFYQGDHNYGGSGVGLAYSKSLMELQGGTLAAYQNPDKGATFYFELPLNQDIDILSSDDDVSKDESQDTGDFAKLKSSSIMLVEDEEELREYLKETFSDIFKNVYTAENGIEALNLLKTNSPDVIVSDVMMPGMNGFELCKAIKTRVEFSHIPVILLTARSDKNSTELGYKMGADAYLTKPFSVQAMISVIQNIEITREKIRERFSKSGYSLLPEEITCSNADEDFMKKLVGVIEKHIDNPEFDVDILVDDMAMSRSSLYGKMKDITGVGVKEFINGVRIKKAKCYLQETDLPIVEIAERTGFSQQRYFSTVFKAEVGTTPTQYRQQFQEKKEENLTD